MKTTTNKSTNKKVDYNEVWEQWELDLLGKYNDSIVAEKTGKSKGKVIRKRHKLNIPPAPPNTFDWTPELIKRLGTVPDSVIAKETGLKRASVGNKRRELGIQRCNYKTSRWENCNLDLLGTCPDETLAVKWNIPVSCIRQKRLDLGIEKWTASTWTEEMVNTISVYNDKTISRRYNISVTEVERVRNALELPPYRYIAWENIKDIEKMAAISISNKYKIPLSVVEQKQRMLGILPSLAKKLKQRFISPEKRLGAVVEDLSSNAIGILRQCRSIENVKLSDVVETWGKDCIQDINQLIEKGFIYPNRKNGIVFLFVTAKTPATNKGQPSSDYLSRSA